MNTQSHDDELVRRGDAIAAVGRSVIYNQRNRLFAMEALNAIPAAEQAQGGEWPANGAYLIRYDDTEQPNELIASSDNARDVAFARYAQVSTNWNAHLFVKIDSNSRDEKCPNAAKPAQGGEVERIRALADAIVTNNRESNAHCATLLRRAADMLAAAPAVSSGVQTCPCGLSTCTEPWEPGCGLGESEEHAQRCSPEVEANINEAIAELRVAQVAGESEVEAVIACLGDDAQLVRRKLGDDSEVATNMERAAQLLATQQPSHAIVREVDDAMVCMVLYPFLAAWNPMSSNASHAFTAMKNALIAALTADRRRG